MSVAAGALIGASVAAPVIGQYMANKEATKRAREQMAFQERMSNTAHQREVQDLRLAGLNPILSVMGGRGATTPVGAMATPENPLKNFAQDLKIGSMLKREQNIADETIDRLKSERHLNNAKQVTEGRYQEKIVMDTMGRAKDMELRNEQIQTEKEHRKLLELGQAQARAISEYYKMVGKWGVMGEKGVQGGVVPTVGKWLKKKYDQIFKPKTKAPKYRPLKNDGIKIDDDFEQDYYERFNKRD